MASGARGLIEKTLDRYGLRSLGDWAWDQHLKGKSIEEIMLNLRKRPEYKERFPAMQDLAQEGRAISEEEYIQYEQQLRQLVSQNGLPQQLYGTREYVADLLLNDVSIAEAQSRMQIAQAASLTAPAEYRTEASRLFGVTAAQWSSIWLETDRTLPELERMFAASAIAGETTIADLGQLSQTMAQRLADAGITPEAARQGLGSLSRELLGRLPGEQRAPLGTDTGVAGALGMPNEQQRVAQRRRERIASFAGGGQAVTTQEGATGLGSTSR